jgi:hypothetical protein
MDSSESISSALPGNKASEEKSECILPMLYAPPLAWYSVLMQHSKAKIDVYENYHKQSYYNRCVIAGPNGRLKLIIPVNRGAPLPLKEKTISYEQDWQTLHWRSLEAAYRRSPYFEYFEDKLAAIYLTFKPVYLYEWNVKLLQLINELTGIKRSFSLTDCYTTENIGDFRFLASPAKEEIPPIKEIKYRQVFEEKNGFLNNLSIFDLIFCEGPYAKEHLNN